MFRRLAAVAVSASVITLALAGCSGDKNSNTGSGSNTTTTKAAEGGNGGGDATAWAEKVCSRVAPAIAEMGKAPAVDPSDPKAGMVKFLDTMSKTMDVMATAFKDAGDPPVSGGDALVAKTVGGLETFKQTLEDSKAELEKVPANDPAALTAAMTKVGTDMEKLSDLEPTKEFENNAELKKAFETAPTCKALNKTDSGSTPTT